MVVERVVGVLAALEERAELDRLVGLVVVHRTHIEAGQPHASPAASARATTTAAPARLT